jgi:hypothetical protein
MAQVGLGLIGIWLVADALLLFVSFASVGGWSEGSSFIFVGVPFALILGFSYLLVFHNAQLARAIAPDADATVDPGATDLARVFFALLGVLLLSESIPSLLNHIVSVAFSAAQQYSNPGERAALSGSLLATAVKAGIGWYLIARSERLLYYVRRPVATTEQ